MDKDFRKELHNLGNPKLMSKHLPAIHGPFLTFEIARADVGHPSFLSSCDGSFKLYSLSLAITSPHSMLKAPILIQSARQYGPESALRDWNSRP